MNPSADLFILGAALGMTLALTAVVVIIRFRDDDGGWPHSQAPRAPVPPEIPAIDPRIFGPRRTPFPILN